MFYFTGCCRFFWLITGLGLVTGEGRGEAPMCYPLRTAMSITYQTRLQDTYTQKKQPMTFTSPVQLFSQWPREAHAEAGSRRRPACSCPLRQTYANSKLVWKPSHAALTTDSNLAQGGSPDSMRVICFISHLCRRRCRRRCCAAVVQSRSTSSGHGHQPYPCLEACRSFRDGANRIPVHMRSASNTIRQLP